MASYKKFFLPNPITASLNGKNKKAPVLHRPNHEEWFCQVLWGTNMSVKADLDKRHVKEEPMIMKEKELNEDSK